MLEHVQFRLLRLAYSGGSEPLSRHVYSGRSKLQLLLGQDIFNRIEGKTVVDFGCGYGDETIDLAEHGAKQAVGLDIREEVLDAARAKAGSLSNISFLKAEQCPRAFADVVISLDSFEHFADPSSALDLMYDLLAPGGEVLVSFGPPWLHPLGGHSFSLFPWSHLLLSERALCRWYNATKNTDIGRFEEVSGGLNRMTVAAFEQLVATCKFSDVSITPVPIRALRHLHNGLTREYTTSVVKCVLKK